MTPRVLAIPCLLAAISAVSSCRSTSSGAPGPIDLHSEHWQQIVAPAGACYASRPIPLHKGTALIPNPNGEPIRPGGHGRRYYRLDLSPRPVAYGDANADRDPDAAVGFVCSNNGGTAGGIRLTSVAVYSGAGEIPESIGLLTPQVQHRGRQATLISVSALTPGNITIEERFFGAADADCCPSGRATTDWTWRDGSFAPSTQVNQPARP